MSAIRAIRRTLRQILQGGTLDVVIEDGLHSTESITTWRSVEPFLSNALSI